MSDLKSKHVFMPPMEFERFKKRVTNLFNQRPDFTDCELLVFTSDEHQNNLAGKYFTEIKPDAERTPDQS